jgi:tyrosinase
MQQVRTAGEMEIIGDTLILTGHEESTELFNIPCEHLQDIRVIRFMDISSHDSTTIIMNLQGLQCSLTIQQADIHGVNFRSPGGHIVWTHCPRGDGEPTITLRGFMVGSLLAPYSTFDVDGYVEGQIIVNNLEGTIYSSRQLFRGCIPTERCALVRSHCTFQQRPQCPNPEEQVDPNDPCCSLWNCSDVCEPCPEVSDDCPSGQTLVVTTEAGAEGFDPCCDTWSCVAVEPDEPVDPFVAECPDDIVIQASLGASEVAVEWAAPRFLYTRTVTCSHHSPLLVSAGDSRYVSCIGQGFKEGTLAACMFEINIKSFNEPTSCSSGGVSYDDKTWFFDKCGQKCLCNAGTPTLCRRVRKPLLQMSDEELTQYWHVFKTVYNDPDGIIQGFVNNHVQMFSRGLHNNGAFLPWHRGYILATENRLREEDCTVTVPYWDQHTQPRLRHNKIWGEERRHCSGNGEAPSRNVYTGTFGSRNGFSLTNGRPLRRRLSGGAAATFSTIESNIYRRYLTAGQFDAMRNRLEHGPGLHDSVHCIVGGTMCSARSSNDPVFFSHHANTDRIWWHWQNLVDGGLTAYTGNTNLNDIMPVSPYTPKEVLNLMAQGPRGDIAVNYWTDEAYVALERLVSEMTPQELALIPTVSTEVTDDTFFWDMNMDPEQIEAIQQARHHPYRLLRLR